MVELFSSHIFGRNISVEYIWSKYVRQKYLATIFPSKIFGRYILVENIWSIYFRRKYSVDFFGTYFFSNIFVWNTWSNICENISHTYFSKILLENICQQSWKYRYTWIHHWYCQCGSGVQIFLIYFGAPNKYFKIIFQLKKNNISFWNLERMDEKRRAFR